MAVIYHYILEKYNGLGWPYNSFLFIPSDRFMDFFNTTIFSKYLLNGEFVYNHTFWNAYMPLANWIGIPFVLIGNLKGLVVYLFLVTFFFLFYWYYNTLEIFDRDRWKSFYSTLFITLTSYPLLFLIDRGNVEGFLFIFLGIFLYFYKKRQYTYAAISLALGTSLKPFLGVFFILYISDKKYREGIIYIIMTVFLYFIELYALPGGFFKNIQYWLLDLNRYDMIYVKDFGGAYFCHTLYNVMHLINSRINIINDINILKFIYFGFAIFVSMIVCIYTVFWEKTYWRKVFLLSLVMVGLPFISNDYTLIHLYFPLLLFFNMNTFDKEIDFFIILFSGLLMIPKQYFIFTHGRTTSLLAKYGIAIFLNPIFIFLLIFLLILYGVKDIENRHGFINSLVYLKFKGFIKNKISVRNYEKLL